MFEFCVFEQSHVEFLFGDVDAKNLFCFHICFRLPRDAGSP